MRIGVAANNITQTWNNKYKNTIADSKNRYLCTCIRLTVSLYLKY